MQSSISSNNFQGIKFQFQIVFQEEEGNQCATLLVLVTEGLLFAPHFLLLHFLSLFLTTIFSFFF